MNQNVSSENFTSYILLILFGFTSKSILFSNSFQIIIQVRGINRVQGIPDQSFHNSLQPYVDMSTLHLLRAEGNCLRSISEFLKQADQLLWLCWSKCPDTSLPSCLRIRNLRALQMTGGELETWCHSESVVKNASFFPLSGCCPEYSKFTVANFVDVLLN